MAYGKGKRRGTYSGRYGYERFTISGAKMFQKDKALKKKNPEKYKRRKKIAKFSADGKIDAREAKKLIKRGISFDKVLNQNIKEYRQAQKRFDDARDDFRSPVNMGNLPTFQPLKIKNAARRRFDKDRLGLDDRPKRQERRKPKPEQRKPEPEEVKDELPEPEITEEAVRETIPTSPYDLDKELNTIRNPRGKIRGGIGQFQRGGGAVAKKNLKSKLLNV